MGETKNILITGAAGNLGTAVCAEFLTKGYQVIATVAPGQGARDLPENPRLEVREADLANEEASARLVQDLMAKYQSVDAALLLVGGFAMGAIGSTGGEDIKKQIALNFETAYYLARPLLVHMKERGRGRILFIGARPAIQPAQGKDLVAYSLSKSLLFRLAELINEEVRGMDIAAAVVVPSTLDTPINRKSMPDRNPDDLVKPAALAGILEFLVSEAGAAIREPVIKVYNKA